MASPDRISRKGFLKALGFSAAAILTGKLLPKESHPKISPVKSDYPAFATKYPSGQWSELILGEWHDVDVIVDPYPLGRF